RPQIVSHLFGPFSRTDQAILLRIPTAKNDRASRLPTLLQQLAEPVGHFEHCRGTAVWIDCAKHPRVTMVPEHDPAILLFVAVDARHDVPDRAQLVIRVDFQTQLHIVGAADVISERQATLKTARTQWAFELRQDRSRNVVSNRLHGDAREVGRFFRFQTRRTGDRWLAGRQWIAGIVEQILHRAALARCDRTPRSFRINIALHVTVVFRIGVDDATDRAILFRDFRLPTAERIAVAHDDYLAFYVHAGLLQIFVVIRQAVVCVDNGRGDVATRAIAVEERRDLRIRRRRIAGHDCFFDTEWLTTIGDQFEHGRRVWIVD